MEQDRLQLASEKPTLKSDLLEIAKRHQIILIKDQNSHEKQKKSRSPYRLFCGPSGENIFVGKTAKESDVLIRQSQGNDYWLHVVEGTGCHVIVPYKSLSPNK